ncbi:unnamed protein product [Linum trigynum]|uniref:Uncharacterized protein n=1 Tax=Linum trigynum TaxID=586398 RepID=A0AAV2E267_9ROSI
MAAATVLIPVAGQINGNATELALLQLGLMWHFRRKLQKLRDTSFHHPVCAPTMQEISSSTIIKVEEWLGKQLSNDMYEPTSTHNAAH